MAWRVVFCTENGEEWHSKKTFRSKRRAERELEEGAYIDSYIDNSLVVGGYIEEVED